MSSIHAATTQDPGSESILVYIPKPGTKIDRTVKRGSAVVGPEHEFRLARTNVYFEGNVYGAVNIVTFADRAMHAYWRMRDRYPTNAQMPVSPQELLRVGTLDPQRGVISGEQDAMSDLLTWLEIPDVPGDTRTLTLQRELCVLGVRR